MTPGAASSQTEPDPAGDVARGVADGVGAGTPLTRRQASDAVGSIGWRLLLGALATTVPVSSMTAAAEAASTITAACGAHAESHLQLDLRPNRVEVTVSARSVGAVTERDVDLAHRITQALGALALAPAPDVVPSRPVQRLELAIDALDISAVRPFWEAVMAYAEEPGREAQADSLADPAGQLPTIWFQQMDAPRGQRNRIHFDITVAHDEGERRVAAALAAGGTMLDDSHASAFWVLADAEGNEVCVCTWQDRDRI